MAFNAVHTGTTGSITATPAAGADEFANPVAVSSWTLSMDQDVVEANAFSPAKNAKTKLPGLYGSSGSCSGFLDNTTPPDVTALFETPGTAIAFALSSATVGIVFSGTGYMTNFSVTAEVAQPVTFSASFEISGAITET